MNRIKLSIALASWSAVIAVSLTPGLSWGWSSANGQYSTIRFITAKSLTGNKCPRNELVELDTKTGLMWVKSPTSVRYSLNAAKKAIPVKYCGYSHWRLPTLNELMSLVNYMATPSGINPARWLNNHGFHNIQPDGYWASNGYAGSNGWFVDMEDGFSYQDSSEKGPFYLWLVRDAK